MNYGMDGYMSCSLSHAIFLMVGEGVRKGAPNIADLVQFVVSSREGATGCTNSNFVWKSIP